MKESNQLEPTELDLELTQSEGKAQVKSYLTLETDTAQCIAYICIGLAGGAIFLAFILALTGSSDLAIGHIVGAGIALGLCAVGGKPANNLGEGFKSWGRGGRSQK